MFFHLLNGRVFGFLVFSALVFHCSGLEAAGASKSAKPAEVAVKYKSEGLTEFHLVDYEEELIECSALAAMHTWIGDNIGQDAGSEVRKAIGEDYWLEISRAYLSLAREAGGSSDLSLEFRKKIKGLTIEWRRLTEVPVNAGEWAGWYALVDRCESWRADKARRPFYNKGREPMAAQNSAPNVAVGVIAK